MRQKEPSRRSKTTSSVDYAPQMWIFLSNYGINWSPRHRTHSISCTNPESTQQNQHMKCWKDLMIGTNTHWRHQGARQSSMTMDHYRCNKFYVLETRAYRTSGLAEYYPQHCSNPNFSPAEHIKELKEEITTTIKDAERTPSNKNLMRALKEKISNFLDGRVQRVATEGDHT